MQVRKPEKKCHNINLLRNNFTLIEDLIKSKWGIFLVYVTKVYSRFLNQNFSISGYKIHCRDRNSFDGVLLFYVNEDILCRDLTAGQIHSK